MATLNGTTDQHPPWEGRCQVLSLDGGGLRGIFSAAVLASLEEDLNSPVLDHFDLVTGTSTGGIIALALGAGVPARSILEFFVEEGPEVFRAPRVRTARQLVRSKYSGRALDSALQRLFGEKLLGDSGVRLVIPTFDMTRNGVYLLKTPHHPRLRRDWRVQMWEAGRATAAAPTYLPALPSPENPPTGIWLTDRDLYYWQCSDPIGFAAWFHDQMRDQFIQRRALLADERAAQIDDVPAWEVKTTLQQAVQVLKRHRDIYFADRQSLKPASILVTTIAGRAYGHQDNLPS